MPKRRTDLQPAYKQQRAEMPDEMKPQLTAIQKLVPLLGFASIALPDTEASYLCDSPADAIYARRTTKGYDAVLLDRGGQRLRD